MMPAEIYERRSQMAFLIVDESRCKKDGICLAECPMSLITSQEESGHPALIPGGDKICNRCGHCVAVCPKGALKHSDISDEDCIKIKPELSLNEEQAIQFLRSRRSIRAYKDKPVEKEKIKRLIGTARYAPTGGNSQMVEWLVLTDKNKLHEIAAKTIEHFRREIKEKPQLLQYFSPIIKFWEGGHDSILWNAPVLVVASAPKEAATGMQDACISLTYLDLLAPAMGLGTCWAGLVQQAIISLPALKDFLGVPADHPYHYPMMLGYPKGKYYRLIARKPPKISFC
jgi:nitroreductase/NAD-dependent dihydropyrimidine dehydrogenase PreA subunit